MALARHFGQSLEQDLRFPHHQLRNDFVVQLTEQIAIARKIAAIEEERS